MAEVVTLSRVLVKENTCGGVVGEDVLSIAETMVRQGSRSVIVALAEDKGAVAVVGRGRLALEFASREENRWEVLEVL